MVEIKAKTITRYEITQKELKEKFGIIGDIIEVGVWSALSPAQEQAGASKDEQVIYVLTEQGDVSITTEHE